MEKEYKETGEEVKKEYNKEDNLRFSGVEVYEPCAEEIRFRSTKGAEEGYNLIQEKQYHFQM